MQTENDTPKHEPSPEQETGEGCSVATCSASFPLCPRCKTAETMEMNLANLRYSCKGCKTTWSRNYLKGWNDGFEAMDNARSPLETSDVRWEYEDVLPEMEDSDFDAIFKASRVDVVRMYPFVEDSKGRRIWITYLPSKPNKEL